MRRKQDRTARSDGAPSSVDYSAFLAGKVARAQPAGFDVPDSAISTKLFPFQRACVAWALRQGRAALFEECGLGKTPQQLEWARLVAEHTGRPTLVLAPLAVAQQTVGEAAKFHIEAVYLRNQADAEACSAPIVVTNYEMLQSFDAAYFGGVVLDESSILKAFSGVMKKRLIATFDATPYKLACTATPAPNDHLELGNHAEFLGIMPSHEMLMRWFINDTMKAGGYRLKRHAEKDFWEWVASWAVCIDQPGDLGPEYHQDGFTLPALTVHEHEVESEASRVQLALDDGALFATGTASATQLWSVKRMTMAERCARAAALVAAEPSEPWIVWCDTNEEADELKRLLPEAIEVRGADSLVEKTRKLVAFTEQRARIIITKPDIAGLGLNWQHCGRQVFAGLTFSFEKLYQALRRSLRYGRTEPVTAHLVFAADRGVQETLKRKQADHLVMRGKMRAAMARAGLGKREAKLVRVDPQIADGDGWQLVLGDAVEVSRNIEADSIDFSVFSPPFSNLYTYSDAMADMGNCLDNAEFFRHFGYLVGELLRVTRPGRLCAVHCKDLPLYMNRDGASGLYDFPGELIRCFEGHGWTFHSRVTIWKDPVIEAARTNSYGLLHKSFTDRTEVCRQGSPDYLVVFRRWTEDMEAGAVKQTRRPGDYIGTLPPPECADTRAYSIQVWQRYASPVWFDIDMTDVLNVSIARANEDEKHLCPLQLGVIARAIDLWTNPGDLVFSPFAGVGSEGYKALQMGRRFLGIELKREYWQAAQEQLRAVAQQGTLFAAEATA